MIYLLDTNVFLESYKPRPHPSFLAWIQAMHSPSLHISVISLGEMRRGIEMKRLRHPESAEDLQQALGDLENLYASRIWNFDAAAAHIWGQMTALHPHHPLDAQIAAIAMAHNAILVTRNTKDFKAFGVTLINPFEPSHD